MKFLTLLFTISVGQVYNTLKVAQNKNNCINAKMIIILNDVTMLFLRKTMLLRDSRSSMCHFKAINNGSHSQLDQARRKDSEEYGGYSAANKYCSTSG
ncbi:hypothetical protein MHB81_12930 [Paenibacillus sp. FSL H7-0326]